MKTKNKPKNVRNNNPLNMEESADWKGEKPTNFDARFEEFKSPKWGFRAGYVDLLQKLERYQNTIQQVIAGNAKYGGWAPKAVDNNHTDNYISYVANKMQMSPVEVITPDMLPQMMLHMSKFEGDNIGYFTLEQAYEGMALAQEESFVIARLARMGHSLGVFA